MQPNQQVPSGLPRIQLSEEDLARLGLNQRAAVRDVVHRSAAIGDPETDQIEIRAETIKDPGGDDDDIDTSDDVIKDDNATIKDPDEDDDIDPSDDVIKDDSAVIKDDE